MKTAPIAQNSAARPQVAFETVPGRTAHTLRGLEVDSSTVDSRGPSRPHLHYTVRFPRGARPASLAKGADHQREYVRVTQFSPSYDTDLFVGPGEGQDSGWAPVDQFKMAYDKARGRWTLSFRSNADRAELLTGVVFEVAYSVGGKRENVQFMAGH